MEELLVELSSNPRDNWLEWEIRPQESTYPQLVKMVNMHQCSVDVSPDSFVYDGTEKCPDIQVVYGGKELVRNKDYEVRAGAKVPPLLYMMVHPKFQSSQLAAMAGFWS